MSVQLQYALVNGVKMLPRHENNRALHGICPHCGGEVVAKIYQDRMSHWAHLNSKMCDKWWESKTEWHIQWQNLFPKEWQEVRVNNPDGNDWHIADICTPDGLVVEFQHSNLDIDERKIREQFYTATKGLMFWVVDGTRLVNDFKRFKKGFLEEAYKSYSPSLITVNAPERYFPNKWLPDGIATIVFDFQGLNSDWLNEDCNIRKPLYVMLSKIFANRACFMPVDREQFVDSIKNGNIKRFLLNTEQSLKQLENEIRMGKLRFM